MRQPDFIVEIFLQPGEFYWGSSDTRIKTLLGSCVALTVWHPRLLVGGMSHSLLPTRGKETSTDELSARYLDEAFELFLKEIRKIPANPADFQVKLFGGGDMFRHITKSGLNIGEKNIQMAHKLIAQHGFQLVAEHVGGSGHRNIIFDLWSGDVWLRHAPI
ncbi:MAG: chemotaxis protein CheD [Leptospiraceae bacterium]|nr:chemotaxis protein CheD [Leptospiraceae bacterium]MDW8306938.1 chemotaxis protein CheD [Leptospiraceae bacterium]